MTEGSFTPQDEAERSQTQEQTIEAPIETTQPAGTPTTEGSVGDGAQAAAGTPDANRESPIEGTDGAQAETPETADQPPQFATEREAAEYKSKELIYEDLKEEFEMSDAEVAQLRAEYGDKPLQELVAFYYELFPEAVINRVKKAPGEQLTTSDDPTAAENLTDPDAITEAQDEAEAEQPAAEPADEDELPDEVAIPLEAREDQVEQVDSDAKEADAQETARNVVERAHRQKAWVEFRKKHLDNVIAKQFADKYPQGAKYDDLTDDEKAVVLEAFEDFWSRDYLPNVGEGEFDGEAKTLRQRMLKAGIDLGSEVWQKGASSTDAITLMRTLLLQDTYRSGHAGEVFVKSESDKGTGIDVTHFKEMCNWSEATDKKGENKRKWMLLCGLLYRQLQQVNGDSPINLTEWINPDKLDDGEIKTHMEELYEMCVVSGKDKVNKALVDAFDPKNGNAELKKPSFLTEVHATNDLIVHFEMMANHSDYLQNFFH